MAEETAGTASMRIVIDTAQFDAAVSAAQNRITGLGTEAVAAYNKMTAAQRRSTLAAVDAANKQGLNAQQVAVYNATIRGVPTAILDSLYEKTSGVKTATEGAAMSARAMNAAMREVPAQITDIVTGLADGQKPLTVLFQQGGQLKDMFGGIVPAAKALGSTFLGMLSPVTLLAAGVVALAVAYEKGSSQIQAFNQANALTGNISGLTSQALADMAASMSKVTGSTSQNADVLAKMTASGKIAAAQFKDVGAAALDFSDATGDSLDKVVAKFTSFGDKPADAISKLNESEHFLTLEVYNQIKAMQDHGNVIGATALAQETYAANLRAQATQISGDLGSLQKAWKWLGDEASSAWNAMLNIGKATPTATLQSQLDALNKQIGEMGGFGTNAEGAAFGNPNQANQARDRLLKQRDDLQAELKKRSDAAAAQAKTAANQRLSDQKITAQQWIDQERKTVRTNQQIRADEINDYKKNAAVLGLSAEQQAKDIAAINKKYKDQGVAANAGQSTLQQRAQTLAALQAQSSSVANLTDGQKQLAKDQQLFNDLATSKDPLTTAQKQTLALKDQILAMDQRIVGQEKLNQKKKDQLSIDAMQKQTQDILSKQSQQYTEQEDGYDLGPQARQQLQDRQKYLDQYSDSVRKAGADHDKQGGTTDDVYQAQLSNAQTLLDGQLTLLTAHYQRLQEIQSDWKEGALRGLNDYAEKTQDVAGEMSDAFSGAFSSLEDSLVNFVTTGKLNFNSLIDSILADIARISIRTGITGPLSSLLSSTLSGLFGGAGSGASAAVEASASAAQSSGGDGIGALISGIVAGGKASGGPVSSDSLYQVNEKGPELFSTGGRTFLMSGAGGGYVTPLTSSQSSRSQSTPGVHIHNYGGSEVEARQMSDGQILVEIDRRIANQTPRVMAQQAGNANSRYSRQMGTSTDTRRRR